MNVRALLLAACIAASGFIWIASAEAGFVNLRKALVVGNGDYAAPGMRLKNPANDARAIADMLSGLGFDVTPEMDVGIKQFRDAVSRFRERARGANFALFYYSGSGVEVQGENYLLPVDIDIAQHRGDKRNLVRNAVSLNEITEVMESEPRISLYFIDTCRDDPFKTGTSRGAAFAPQVTRVETGANALVSFAAEAGQLSMDGEGRHSPYTQALLEVLPKPGLDLTSALRIVRKRVAELTHGRQRPAFRSSLIQPVYLAGPPVSAGRSPDRRPTAPDRQKSQPQAETKQRIETAERAFKVVTEMAACHGYKAFVKRYPDTFYADVAREWISEHCQGAKTARATAAPQPAPETGGVASAEKTAKRLALLIGNKNYKPAIGELKNPHNDLRVLGAALRRSGFEVMEPVRDATRKDLLRAVSAYVSRLAALGDDAIGFFYYSGHGAAETDKGPNYLIPVDAESMDGEEMWYDSVSLPWVIRKLKEDAPEAAHFVVFDACRNELKRRDYRNGQKGFVAVREDTGIFIAFASAPGTRALDGEEGATSPYVASLAKQLVIPDQHHLDVFQSTKEEVYETTGKSQTPWERNGLLRRVYFMRSQEVASRD